MTTNLTRDQLADMVRIRYKGNLTACAKGIGVTRSRLWHIINGDRGCETFGVDVSDEEESVTSTSRGDEAQIVTRSVRITTVDEALDMAGYDMSEWYVVDSQIKRYTTTVKVKSSDGTTSAEAIVNYSITVRVKRLAPAHVQKSIKLLLKDMPKVTFPKPDWRNSGKTKHLLELCLFDLHFGKSAIKLQSGDDYSVGVARELFDNAIEELLNYSSGFDYDQAIFPLGQDFFHFDNWKGQTNKGTQLTCDGLCQTAFQLGCQMTVDAIQTIRNNVSPVHILWSPGNHDRETSFYLCQYIDAYFRSDKHVTVDLSLAERKFYRYHKNLIGFAHEVKESRLPLDMACSRKEDWAEVEHTEWHIGHWHRTKETFYKSIDSEAGVAVRVIPSLSGCDKWHYDHLFSNTRAASAMVWHPTRGRVAEYTSTIDRDGSLQNRSA